MTAEEFYDTEFPEYAEEQAYGIKNEIIEFAEAYAEHCENEYRAKLNKLLNNLGEDKYVELEQENKELRELYVEYYDVTEYGTMSYPELEEKHYKHYDDCKQALKK